MEHKVIFEYNGMWKLVDYKEIKTDRGIQRVIRQIENNTPGVKNFSDTIDEYIELSEILRKRSIL